MRTSKIGVIISHEFITRISSKGFIIGTLIGPLILALFVVVPIIATIFSEDSKDKKVLVHDLGANIGPAIIAQDTSLFRAANVPVDSSLSLLKDKAVAGVVVIPADVVTTNRVELYSTGGGLQYYDKVETAIDQVVVRKRLSDKGTDTSVIAMIEKGVVIDKKRISEKGVEKDFGEAMAMVGYVLGFIMYGMVLTYGGTVMKAVTDEKSNRIIEVLASSAKPYEIMMGKIIGVGAVGAVQVTLWILFSALITGVVVPLVISSFNLGAPPPMPSSMPQTGQAEMMQNFSIPSISPWIGIAFFFYFITGYLIYSSLYAGLAAAIDQEQDAQSLMMPVTMLVIIPILLIGNVMASPDGMVATVASLVPFFTPIIMMVRLTASDVPLWQIGLSVVLMVGTFVGCVWAASRVYRIGILTYGRKVKFTEIVKWIWAK